MAFTDAGGKIILHSWGRFKGVLTAACVIGDLLAADNSGYGLKLADGVGVSVPTIAVACEDGAIGDVITCALAAEIKASPSIATGGVVTAGAFFASTDVGAPIYTGDAGKIALAGGTMTQAIGYVLATDRYTVVPGGYLTSTSLSLSGALTVGTTTTLTGIATLTAGVNSQIIIGSRFTVSMPSFGAADVAKGFWVAPAACKVIEALEAHGTVAGQAGNLNVEKCNTSEAAGVGNVVLATGWDLTSTVNTPVTLAAVSSGEEVLVDGDELRLRLSSGAATSLADAVITVVLEWA